MVLTGTARSQSPGQPRPDGLPPGGPDGPMAERLKHRLEELRRDGKKEEAERLERRAHEMMAFRHGNPQGERREESPRKTAAVNPGERERHLAEAAKQLREAGINVSPEMLERLGHRGGGTVNSHSRNSNPMNLRSQSSSGSHNAWAGGHNAWAGGAPWQDQFMQHRVGKAFGAGPRVNTMHTRSGSPSGRPGVPPAGSIAPGAGSPLDAMHNEIRVLAKQVQDLRSMMQPPHGGEASRGSQGPVVRRPNLGEPRAQEPQTEQRWNRQGAPGAPDMSGGHREGPARPPSGDRPRAEAGPSHPPGNPPPPADRPRGGAPFPPPGQ